MCMACEEAELYYRWQLLERIAKGWRPFRTWTAVLVRVAGDRLGLPIAA